MRNLMWPLIWGTTTLIGGATTLIGINYYRRNHIKIERITADEARILQASPEMDIIRQKLIKPDLTRAYNSIRDAIKKDKEYATIYDYNSKIIPVLKEDGFTIKYNNNYDDDYVSYSATITWPKK